MARDTSLRALEEIRREGLLGAVQLRVYELLFEEGPLTAREVTKYFQAVAGSDAITTYQPRLRELEAMGAVSRGGARPCGVTGRLAYVWDVTSGVPSKRGPALKKAQLTREKIARLAEECVRIYDERERSEDFFALIQWLQEQAA